MDIGTDPGQILAAIADAVVVTDARGAVTYWNAAAQRLFGFTPEEALGRSMDIFIPERLRRRHWDGFHETMRTGVTRYGSEVLRVPAINKDGGSLSIAFTLAMLYGPDGRPGAAIAIIRDETQRFAQERTLKKRLAELEALATGNTGDDVAA